MNIFQAVIRPFQTQTSQTGVTNQQTAGASDREEDGFLMVAETESERTTVYASDFTGDTPPDYNQVLRERDRQTDSREREKVERERFIFLLSETYKIKVNFFFLNCRLDTQSILCLPTWTIWRGVPAKLSSKNLL